MLILRSFLYGIILLSFSAQAWQLSLKSTDTNTQIMVSNDQKLRNVDVYLVWTNLDAKKDQFKSLNASAKWKKNLSPVYSDSMDIAPFKSFKVADLDESCPEDQRCFLALVAVKAGEDPIDTESWQASSIVPLSLAASRERLPGQQFFLSNDYVNRYNMPMDDVEYTEVGSAVDTDTSQTMAPEASKTADSNDSVTTEKPDIFRLVGDKLLYANSAAKRFQVIDVSDYSNPKLIGWVALSGNPIELYVLNDYYILLQVNYDNGYREPKTEIVVLQQGVDNTLNTVQKMDIPGQFIESRRRGNYIYSVSQQYGYNNSWIGNGVVFEECADCDNIGTSIDNKHQLYINVLEVQADGTLKLVDETKILGYSPQIAIFQDNLVIANHNPEERNWATTQIQVFDLTQSDPLVEYPLIKVPGQVPSEFHLSILNKQLRVVYGPEDRTDGSTLAIYNLSFGEVSLAGKVDKIAPGEGLFATRFVDDRAFVVTYERTDPLWVIDLSDSSNPTILGELIIPGWSEKLFFHEDRLFAVGMDDQVKEGEELKRARRVAVSLFNVEDPTKPTLINRITPLVGQVSYSSSPALSDERALLLNWQDSFAALPINSWYRNSNSHLQIVSFADDKLEDVGLLPTPTQLQRSLMLDSNVLAGLGDQSLITLRWGVDQKPEILGELELATNLNWLKLQNGSLWSAAIGSGSYNRFYRFNTNNLETPERKWSLSGNYNSLMMDEEMVVFYDLYGTPGTLEILPLDTEELLPPIRLLLEDTDEIQSNSLFATDDVALGKVWYDRRSPLLHDGIFYIAEQQQFKSNPNMFLSIPEQDYWQSQWVLRSWNLRADKPVEAPQRSIPGTPLAITKSGMLITQEMNLDGKHRLNLLALKADHAVLIGDYNVHCDNYARFMWADDTLYVTCQIRGENFNGYTDMVTRITQLSTANNGFVEIDSWTIPLRVYLQAAADGIIMANVSGYTSYYDKALTNSPAEPQSNCNVYQLIPGQEPILLKNLVTCLYGNDRVVLTHEQILNVEGYAGIKSYKF